MSTVGVRYLFLPAFVALLQPIATNAAEHQRPILAESPDRPRFELRDRELHVDDPKAPWADMQALFQKNSRRDSAYRGWYCSHSRPIILTR